MRVFKDNEELKSCILDGVININDSIECNFNIDVEADITANDIKARDITANGITAWDIISDDINARDINSWDIKANNIKANNINSYDIKAYDINAIDISYYAFCVAFNNIKCESIKGCRKNSFHKCLDGKLTNKEKLKEVTIKGQDFELTKEEINNLKKQLC